jgi:hypothetical protein
MKGDQGRMKMNVHIDRLILEGLPATSAQGPQIGAAIQQELVRLLTAHGLTDELRGGIAVPRIRAGVIQLGAENQPVRLGNSIAQAVHEGIGNSKQRRAGNTGRPNPGGVPK